MYVGKTTLTEAALDIDIAAGRVIELEECRVMRTVMSPVEGGGIGVTDVLTPLGSVRGAVRYKVRPAGYLWPDEYGDAYTRLLEKIETANSIDLEQRAQDAGLVTPDGMRRGPGGNTPV
jgi:hypothetical protein